MPSQRPAGSLLCLAAPLDDGEDDFVHYPWGWSAWQKRTGLLNTPFIPGLDFWKDDPEAQAVKAFARSFWEKGDAQRTAYMIIILLAVGPGVTLFGTTGTVIGR